MIFIPKSSQSAVKTTECVSEVSQIIIKSQSSSSAKCQSVSEGVAKKHLKGQIFQMLIDSLKENI